METPIGRPTVLTPAEEELLVHYILHMAMIGFPLTVNYLFSEVQKIVLADGRKSTMKDGKPGETWKTGTVAITFTVICYYSYFLIYFYFRGSLNTFTTTIETLIANYLLNVKISNTLAMEEVYKKKT